MVATSSHDRVLSLPAVHTAVVLLLLSCPWPIHSQTNSTGNDSCIVTDGFSMQSCLADPEANRSLLQQSAYMNLSTSPAEAKPIPIERNVTILSDPRGPRLIWDFGLLSNRFQLQSNLTLTMQHIITTNCSSSKPLSFIRLSSGSRAVVNDTITVQSDGLCLDPTAGAAAAGAAAPPAAAGDNPGAAPTTAAGGGSSGAASIVSQVPAVTIGLPGAWCSNSTTASSSSNAPFYADPSWPLSSICNKSALLFYSFTSVDTHGWVEARPPAATGADQQQRKGPLYGSDTDLVNGSYSGVYTLHGINSALACPVPLDAAICTSLPNARNPASCLTAASEQLNPDRRLEPGAAEYLYAAAAAAAGGGGGGGGESQQQQGNRGLRVVLPAVLASVVGAAVLASILGLLYRRHRRQQQYLASSAASAPDKFPPTPAAAADHQQRDQNTKGHHHDHMLWMSHHLDHHDHQHQQQSVSDVNRQLLSWTPEATTATVTNNSRSAGTLTTTATDSSSTSITPDGISLNVLLGAGSFGRVHAGTWTGQQVAVKVITHSSTDDDRIDRELTLSLSFDHPNLVRALHYVKLPINPKSAGQQGDVVSPGSELFLPQGAVGVFTLPKDWAITQRVMNKAVPVIDTETWIVMDLMDCGTLAMAIRHHGLFRQHDGSINMGCLLRRAADVAAGLAYLHSRNVCHGDLKCENVLLRSEPQDRYGLVAKIADFGLSRALAMGQSHLSTKRYGTVTHMPPELLVSGKLTPDVDVYSFGIMLWEFVSGAIPFAGMHHGEIIHSVVTADLRPGPWPQLSDHEALPASYVSLAEACWARQAGRRPAMSAVLQEILVMLGDLETGD